MRLQCESVGAFEVLVLQGGAGLNDIAANLRNDVLLVVAERSGEGSQVLFGGIEQLRRALLRLGRGTAGHIRRNLGDIGVRIGSGRLRVRCG